MRSSLVTLCAMTVAACGGGTPTTRVDDVAALSWDSVHTLARGTTVTWRMWRGDPSINRYVDDWITPRLAACCEVTLRTADGQGPEILQQLRLERAAGAAGTTDLAWINGETFAALQRDSLLGGPWAHRLPAAQFLDSVSTIIMRDFERPTEGYEMPWGRVQFALVYDSLRTPSPPRSVSALAEWIRTHPGRFTHDQGFTGTTFLKVVLYALNGGVGTFQGGFDEATWNRTSPRLFTWLETLVPFFWREGGAYPQSVADLDRLFANGEVDFAMGNNHLGVATKVRRGTYPASAQVLMLNDGMIANTHYLGIPANATNPAGAMIVANFLLSPAAQYEKQRVEVWADGTVLAIDKLPVEWQHKFAALVNDPSGFPDSVAVRLAVPEVAGEWHDRVVSEWRRRIRSRGGE